MNLCDAKERSRSSDCGRLSDVLTEAEPSFQVNHMLFQTSI